MCYWKGENKKKKEKRKKNIFLSIKNCVIVVLKIENIKRKWDLYTNYRIQHCAILGKNIYQKVYFEP